MLPDVLSIYQPKKVRQRRCKPKLNENNQYTTQCRENKRCSTISANKSEGNTTHPCFFPWKIIHQKYISVLLLFCKSYFTVTLKNVIYFFCKTCKTCFSRLVQLLKDKNKIAWLSSDCNLWMISILMDLYLKLKKLVL